MKLLSLLLLYVFLQNVCSEDKKLICETSHLNDLLNVSKIDKQLTPEKCVDSQQVKSLVDAIGFVGTAVGDVESIKYSCFTITASVRFGRNLKYRGCMPQGMCKAVEKVFSLIRHTGGIKGTTGKFLFTGSKCAECNEEECNTLIQSRVPSVSNAKLSCEISPLKPIIYSANLDDLSYKPEYCMMSRNVSFMLNKFENVGKILPHEIVFQCFTLSAKKTIDNEEIEVRGCVPKGDCQIVEKIFSQIPVMDNRNQTIILLKNVKCKECKGEMCNSPTLPKGEQGVAPLRHLSIGLIFIVFVQFLV